MFWILNSSLVVKQRGFEMWLALCYNLFMPLQPNRCSRWGIQYEVLYIISYCYIYIYENTINLQKFITENYFFISSGVFIKMATFMSWSHVDACCYISGTVPTSWLLVEMYLLNETLKTALDKLARTANAERLQWLWSTQLFLLRIFFKSASNYTLKHTYYLLIK